MSGSSEAASTSSHVQFTMTVKVDIETPAATTGTASSSSSTICAAAAAAAAASAGTQDLLLKLQPLLPQLCIAPRHQQQEACRSRRKAASGSAGGGGGGGGGGDSGLELSLGLPVFNKALSSPRDEEDTASPAAPSPLLPHTAAAAAAEMMDKTNASAGGGGAGGLEHQPSLLHSESSMPVDWRLLEQQRLKREVQCQKRQEARKKRRILIDEQKLQRRMSSSAAPQLHYRHKKPKEEKEEEDHVKSLAASRSTRSVRGGKKRKTSLDSSLDSDAGIPEAQDHTAQTTSTMAGISAGVSFGGVIRPSPVLESKNEWVHKFLEVRKMVRSPASCEEGEAVNQVYERLEEPQSIVGSVPVLPDSQSSSVMVVAREPIAYLPVASSSTVTTSTTLEQQHEFKLPTTDHCLTSPPPSTPQDSRLPPPPSRLSTPSTPSSLLRSSSLGTLYRDRAQEHQRSSTIQAPSPMRCTSSLMRTLSESAAMRSRSSIACEESWSKRSSAKSSSSAFRIPKKEKEKAKVERAVVDWDRRGSASASSSSIGGAGMPSELPWVSTRGTGPNGKTVTGVLFAYKKGEVKIVCTCHGQHMSAREFVEHAGGVDVSHPEKCIVVTPAKPSFVTPI